MPPVLKPHCSREQRDEICLNECSRSLGMLGISQATSCSPKEGVVLFPKQLKKEMTDVKPKVSPQTLSRQNFAHGCISINNYLRRSITELSVRPLNAI